MTVNTRTASLRAPALDPKRWPALVVSSVATLMVVLDVSIANIALPHAQSDLGMTDVNRQWMITAYALAFGGLLLLGGRIADFIGCKRTVVIGLLGFAAASVLGGTAPEPITIFAALLAPAALSLITVAFTDPKERSKAFGIYGAFQGAGGAVGLLLGGTLTEYAGWRWCMYINVPIALAAVVAARFFVRESRAVGEHRYDVPPVPCWPPAVLSPLSTDVPRRRRARGGRRPPPSCCSPSPPSCSRSSSWWNGARRTRCCRCGW
ncbi:MFS transporter [Streptomyces sp. NPDC001880]